MLTHSRVFPAAGSRAQAPRSFRARRARAGFTLIEILVASVIGSVVAGGTLAAFVTAVRISEEIVSASATAFFAEQTLERFRNRIACDDAWFNDSGDCTPDRDLPRRLTNDPAPWPPVRHRRYQIREVDCDGVGGPGDCLEISVQVLTRDQIRRGRRGTGRRVQ